MPFQPFLCRLWNVKVVDKLFGRLLSRRLGSTRLFDRLASMLLRRFHLGQSRLDRVLCRCLFGALLLEHGRLGMICGRRRCSGIRSRRSRNRLVIVPMIALDVLLILFAEGCH
jgi:hypothetical protein